MLVDPQGPDLLGDRRHHVPSKAGGRHFAGERQRWLGRHREAEWQPHRVGGEGGGRLGFRPLFQAFRSCGALGSGCKRASGAVGGLRAAVFPQAIAHSACAMASLVRFPKPPPIQEPWFTWGPPPSRPVREHGGGRNTMQGERQESEPRAESEVSTPASTMSTKCSL